MISVIIVNYFSAQELQRAVRSVLSGAVETEIIIVDNTCTGKERETLGEMQKAYGFSLILNSENLGFAKACNQALAAARGDYIFLLNPDAFVAPSCLETLQDFLDKTPAAGCASPQVYWDDQMQYFFPHYTVASPFQSLCVRLSTLSRMFRTLYSLSERRRNVALWRSSVPVKTGNLHGGVVMIRRSAAERAGGLFDERFFMFYEDTDLFLRLRKNGYGLYIIPESKAVHNYSHKLKKLDIMSKTGPLYYKKHFRRSLLLSVASSLPEGSPGASYQSCTSWKTPPVFDVPGIFQGGYLFEWSPNPLFVPSIGFFGKGEKFALSEQVWGLLENGKYYSRFSFPAKNRMKYTAFCWEKDA